MPYPDNDARFMEMARSAALMATCQRRKVGAVLVLESMVLAVGQNRAPRGAPHCIRAGCNVVGGHCVRTIHAEAAAILAVSAQPRFAYAPSDGPLTLYVTTSPCYSCANFIINAGIKRVVFDKAYHDASHNPSHNNYDGPLAVLDGAGIAVVPFEPEA